MNRAEQRKRRKPLELVLKGFRLKRIVKFSKLPGFNCHTADTQPNKDNSELICCCPPCPIEYKSSDIARSASVCARHFLTTRRALIYFITFQTINLKFKQTSLVVKWRLFIAGISYTCNNRESFKAITTNNRRRDFLSLRTKKHFSRSSDDFQPRVIFVI